MAENDLPEGFGLGPNNDIDLKGMDQAMQIGGLKKRVKDLEQELLSSKENETAAMKRASNFLDTIQSIRTQNAELEERIKEYGDAVMHERMKQKE